MKWQPPVGRMIIARRFQRRESGRRNGKSWEGRLTRMGRIALAEASESALCGKLARMFSITPQARRNIAYWAATGLLEFEMVLGGIWDVLRVPHVREVVDRLGYPEYFLVILGVWKLLGSVALVIPRFPRLKEWTYAGVIFNFTGAIASHLASRDIEVGALAYLGVMTGVTFASWALRPPSRRAYPRNES